MDKRLPANAALEDMVGYQLQLASSAFLADWIRTSGEVDMKRIQFVLLAVIAEYPGIRQGQAGEKVGIQRAYMVALINDLLEKGLVVRERDALDRRVLSLRITGKGRRDLEAALHRVKAHEMKMLANFSGRERDELKRLLRKISA